MVGFYRERQSPPRPGWWTVCITQTLLWMLRAESLEKSTAASAALILSALVMASSCWGCELPH